MSAFWRKLRGERPLLLTHRPPFQDPDRAVGRVVDVDGELFRVTCWVEMPKVTLTRGGYAPEWQLWGRRATDDEVASEVELAAQSILEQVTDEGDVTGGDDPS
jgi:hypothetical protein